MKKIRHLLLLFFTTVIMMASEPAPSELELLLDELTMASRVTNAVALRSYVEKGKVNLNEVLAEILRTSNSTMTSLLEIDFKETEDTMNWISEQVKSMRQKYNGSLSSEIEVLEKSGKQLVGFTRLATFFNGSIGLLTPDQFVSKFNLINSSAVNFCEDHIAEVREVSFVLDMNDSTIPESVKNIVLSSINTSANNLLTCLKEDGTFNVKLTNYSDEFKQLHNFVFFGDGAKSLNEKLKDFIELPNQFERIKNVSKSLESFWGVESLPKWSKSLETVRTVFDMYNGKKKVNASAFTMTAGFRNLADFRIVRDDLRNAWFVGKIAGNNRTDAKILERALDPFQKFSDSVDRLTSSFNATYVRWNSIPSKIDFFESIRRMPKFIKVSGQLNLTLFFENIEQELTKCVGKMKITSSANIPNYTQVFSKFSENVVSAMKGRRLLEEVSMQFALIKSNSALAAFQAFVKELVHNFNTDNFIPKSAVFAKLKNSSKNYESFKKIIVNTVGLQKTQDVFRNKFPGELSASVASDLNLDPFWEGTDVKKALNCLMDVKLESANMRLIMNYFLSVDQFPEFKVFETAAEMFASAKIVQEDLKNLLNLMKTELSPPNALLKKFVNPMEISQRFSKGVNALMALKRIRNEEEMLLSSTEMRNNPMVKAQLIGKLPEEKRQMAPLLINWFEKDPKAPVKQMLKALKELDPIAKAVRNDSTQMKRLLKTASKIRGFPVKPDLFKLAASKLDFMPLQTRQMEQLAILDLSFASYEGHLIGAATSYDQLLAAYGTMYYKKKKPTPLAVNKPEAAGHFLIIILSVSAGLLVIFILIGLFGLTKRGKSLYKKWYLYYFGKERDFEKRWRYSYFMDTVDDENVVDGAVRLANPSKLLAVLKRGAYVDAYNKWGNTALHTCVRSLQSTVKTEFVEMVQILIKHGADRSLLNFENKTAEQSLPDASSKQTEQSRQVAELFRKYRKKRYRLQVPQEFTSSMFHIYCEEHLDDALAEKFIEKFKSITTEEVLSSTTHIVLRVDQDGCLATNDFNMLSWVFRGFIVVRDQWMEDCLKDPSLIEHDDLYLVDSVKYNGKFYLNTVRDWADSFAKFTMPYLLGVHVVVLIKECKFYNSLQKLVAKLGGVVLREVPPKESFNRGAHPYLHVHLNPVWILHDRTSDLTSYQSDKDWLFSFFTEQEFAGLMLARKVNRDTSKNPIPIVAE